MKVTKAHLILLCLIFCFISCQQFRQLVVKQSPRANFSESLGKTDLLVSKMAEDWESNWLKAIAKPFRIELPYSEVGIFIPHESKAIAFQFGASQGELIQVEFKANFQVFAELRLASEPKKVLQYLTPTESIFGLEVENSAEYLLVLQPYLLEGGNFKLDH